MKRPIPGRRSFGNFYDDANQRIVLNVFESPRITRATPLMRVSRFDNGRGAALLRQPDLQRFGLKLDFVLDGR